MTSTTFTSRTTIIPASWLNDVNDFVYEGVIPGSLVIPVVSGGTGASTASGARTNLGLVIGTNVQAYDIELQAIAGLTSAADTLPYFTGSGTAALTSFTSAGRALVDDANAAAQRTTLGVTATGSDTTYVYRANNLSDLANASTARTNLGLGTLATQNGTFSGTSSGTNTGDQTITLTGDVTGNGTGSFAATIGNTKVTYTKIQNTSGTDVLIGRSTAGAGSVEEIACTSAGRALIDDANASAQRTTLGLGTIATQDANNVSISGGLITGITDITVADGGTGVSTMTTAYAPVCAGTTATGALQVASTGLSTSGYILTSNGASAVPSFQANVGGTDFTGDSGSGGTHGLVIAPATGDATKFLRGDATWSVPSGSGDMVLAAVQTVTGAKTFGTIGGAVGKFILAGSTSGSTILNAAATAGSGTITLPTGTDTLAGLGTAQTFTAVQTITQGDLALLGSSTGKTTLNSGLSSSGNNTLTLPTTSSDTLAALGTAQTWTGVQQFGTIGGTVGKLVLAGSTSGSSILNAAATAGSTTFTLPGTSGTIQATGTNVNVADGGTGVSTMTTAYAPVCAGTTATGALQVASTGLSTSGFVLTSNGASALPSFQAVSSPSAASQSDQETATSTTTYVSPGRQQYHPGHPKFWAYITVSAGTPTLTSSYNMTSITDTATGRVDLTIATDFSSASWCCSATIERDTTSTANVAQTRNVSIRSSTIAAGSVEIECLTVAPALVDPASWHVIGFGDQ